jgi:hypothetical protein
MNFSRSPRSRVGCILAIFTCSYAQPLYLSLSSECPVQWSTRWRGQPRCRDSMNHCSLGMYRPRNKYISWSKGHLRFGQELNGCKLLRLTGRINVNVNEQESCFLLKGGTFSRRIRRSRVLLSNPDLLSDLNCALAIAAEK